MKVIFVSTGTYPNQHAAAIRHSTLAQGMAEQGHDVCFYILSSQDWSNSELNYNGVKFISLNDYKGNNRISKIVHFFGSLHTLRRKIIEAHKKSLIDAIVVYSIENLVIQVLLGIRNKTRIKLFHERTELPYIVGKSETIIGRLKYYIYLKKLIPKLDGIFVISDKLVEFFSPHNKTTCKLLTVVDTVFFSNIANSTLGYKYIAYCGTMSGTKDGVPILIKSFAKLSRKFPEFKLLLIGDNSNVHSIEETTSLIDFLGLTGKVNFTGFIEREKMPVLLGNASLLVVSKPDNEQNSGNFPIKIGEYLATGIPIVVTKVGEIPRFIIDGETGFLAEPDSVDSFYQKMKEALSDYNRALRIGKNGQKMAKKIFDYKIQAQEMSSFIKAAD